uniref:DNA-directed RNA polymerase subunit n=1 Tax=Davidia involucrata TaxID=16924 RepID=A0A5B7BQD2_DAVIN
MFLEVECLVHVMIPAKNLDRNGLVPRSSIVSCLLKDLLIWKATEEYGYFLTVTKLKSIGNQEFEESSRDIICPVAFFCRTFLPVNGEIMLGVVHTVHRHGVFLKCGPMKYIFLSARKMPNYYYVDGKNPLFLSNDLSRIEYDVVIRFMVFGVRWTKKKWEIEREFMILASLEGDCLGPISLPGSNGMDL